MLLLLAVCVCWTTWVGAEASNDKVADIRVDETLYSLQLNDGQSLMVHLHGLVTGESYEIRVSYPATTPTDFFIKVQSQRSAGPAPGRRLLNIEKVQFEPTAPDYLGSAEHFARVTAWRTGVARRKGFLQGPVTFNIALERLYHGLPQHAWQSVAIMVFGLLCALFLLPFIRRLIMRKLKHAV